MTRGHVDEMFGKGLETWIRNSREKLDANLGIFNTWIEIDTMAMNKITQEKL